MPRGFRLYVGGGGHGNRRSPEPRPMTRAPRRPAARRRVRLRFDDPVVIDGARVPVHRELSAVVRAGRTLFLGCDEGAGIERLVEDGDGFGSHRHLRLGELVDLPAGPDGEADVEGLAIDEGWLWVVGSQALRRRKPRSGDGAAESLGRLADLEWEPNRQLLGRFPLVEEDGALLPVARDGKRAAAHLRFGGKGRLRRWLGRDPHLAPFLGLPSKDNGLDVEGIVARGERIWLGLRGPVLGEGAVILEMRMRTTRAGHLKARRIDGRARYRKHVVDTNGQGIRDMKWDGDDLLVIVGNVLSGDGPTAILRLHGFARRRGGGHVPEARLKRARELPDTGPLDHPEGLVRWKGKDWLVVHDSPGPTRVGDDPPWVDADVWRVP